MTTYQITDKSGNQVIDAGSDLVAARVQAQSYADRWCSESYLSERGADEDDFETFGPRNAIKDEITATARRGDKLPLWRHQHADGHVTWTERLEGTDGPTGRALWSNRATDVAAGDYRA